MPKTTYIRIRMSEDEKHNLQLLAEYNGKNTSVYLRDLLYRETLIHNYAIIERERTKKHAEEIQ